MKRRHLLAAGLGSLAAPAQDTHQRLAEMACAPGDKNRHSASL